MTAGKSWLPPVCWKTRPVAGQMVRPHNEASGPESDDDIIERHRRVTLLDALAMPVKDGPRPDKSASKGRPRAAESPTTWPVTVQCPAALGIVNCPLVKRADGLRDPNIPDVPDPPEVRDPSLLPRSCDKTTSPTTCR